MSNYQPTTGTSRVIDDLQSTIDSLKIELNETKANLNETKQKYSILTKRNETMVEQLSNSKHQAEVAESLLKRKERRVMDLEFQLTELTSNNDNYRFELENLKSKLLNSDNEKFRLLSENERLSKSYEVLQNSFNDYKLLINSNLENLNNQIPDFINKTKSSLSDNLNNLKLNQPEIDSSYNLLIKNSKRLEELYNQKYDKVNNYLLLLSESTKQHGQATSIVMEECEEILKKLNRNEDVLLKIKNETNGNLTDLNKMKELIKRRDLSILSNSNSNSTTLSPPLTPSNNKNKISLDSPILIKNETFERKRAASPNIIDSRFNSPNTRQNSPNLQENITNNNSIGNSNNNNNNHTNNNHNNNNDNVNTNQRSNKRNSINIQKKDRRKRNSFRQSMNQEDFISLSYGNNNNNNYNNNNYNNNNSNNNNSNKNSSQRISSNNNYDSQLSPSYNNINRSNSTRKNNNRNSRNFSAGSNHGYVGNNNTVNNRRWSMQPPTES